MAGADHCLDIAAGSVQIIVAKSRLIHAMLQEDDDRVIGDGQRVAGNR